VVATGTESVREWRELAREVEALGYSSLLIGDHFVDFEPVGGFSPLLALASAAEATTDIRVGSLVLGNDYRHPAVVAKDAATLDVLSDGRLEFGLGAGWLRSDYAALGLSYDAPDVRVKRLEEALTVIKSAWLGDPFSFAGSHYSINGYAGSPKPLQQPRPPIIVGGGSQRVLMLAGAQADIVGVHVSMRPGRVHPGIVSDTQEAQTRLKLEWVKQGAGSRFDELELQMMCQARITEHPQTAVEPIAARLGVGVEDCLASTSMLVGTVEEVCELVERRRAELGVSYIALQSDAYREFSPVVARLAGS
jgi:probable F420-dependent oxidoreductase